MTKWKSLKKPKEDEFIHPINKTSRINIDIAPDGILAGEAPKPLYRPAMWAGTVPTFRCETCGSCEPDEGNIILHVLSHVPENERDALLEKLTKEK